MPKVKITGVVRKIGSYNSISKTGHALNSCIQSWSLLTQ